ncbi:MAG: C1 family peptidase [Bacteroidota bacterium]
MNLLSTFPTICCLLALLTTSPLFGQEEIRNRPDGNYLFTIEKDLAATEVKSQGRSGTCWSFSTVSFFESELIRQGKGQHDLSEMFVVRHVYERKAELYVRMHGKANFGPGGLLHDANKVYKRHGMVPESAYSGKTISPRYHDHGEMDEVLLSMVEGLVGRDKPSSRWKAAIGAVLDAYLGEIPESFSYEGNTYTPESFANFLGINPDDYVELTSFTHHPYYEKSVLEVPDNWDWHQMWNVPLDELVEAAEHALDQGYTVAWDADVSEKTFSHRNAVAIIPEQPFRSLSAAEQAELFNSPQPEKEITAEDRQAGFDDLSTTDDHLMHIIGLAKDQQGSPYFVVKNSWGQGSNQCGGYLYVSQPYYRSKTIHIMLHKDALPADLKEKLGL